MGKLKKIGIGLVGFIGVIFVIMIIVNVTWYNSLDPAEREKYDDDKDKERKELEKEEKLRLQLDQELAALLEGPSQSVQIEKTKKLTTADYEILDSKKQMVFYEESILDVWANASFFNKDSTKEEILADKISSLKNVIPKNSEELEYLKEDLSYVTTEFGITSIKSQIKWLQNIIDYDKQKLSDLETNGIKAFEEYSQNEDQQYINKYLEQIQRLENLNSKNLEYFDTDDKVASYIFNYKGNDNKGNTLQTEVELFIKEKYGRDALTENNSLLKDNWIKTNTIFYFGTDAINEFSRMDGRYKAVTYAFFYPLQGEYKTIIEFGFDTETYEVVAGNENSIDIINKLN